MKRPQVTLENQKAVYEYYAERNPDPRTAHFLHRLFSIIYHPHIAFADGAEETTDAHFRAGGRLLLAADHTSGHDPLVLASVAQRKGVLHPLLAKTFIPGHVGLFNHRIIRPFLDNFVALPTFRGKDVARSGLPDETAQKLRASAGKALVDICIAKADENWNIAIFPQGTRKEGRVRSGIGQIACNIQNPEQFRILPVAIDYSHTSTNLWPNVFVGVPFDLPETPEEVTMHVETSLQICAARAEEM